MSLRFIFAGRVSQQKHVWHEHPGILVWRQIWVILAWSYPRCGDVWSIKLKAFWANRVPAKWIMSKHQWPWTNVRCFLECCICRVIHLSRNTNIRRIQQSFLRCKYNISNLTHLYLIYYYNYIIYCKYWNI